MIRLAPLHDRTLFRWTAGAAALPLQQAADILEPAVATHMAYPV